MSLVRRRICVAFALLCLASLPASALTISPNYDAGVPPEVQTAFNYAADLWDTAWIASVAASGAGSTEDTYQVSIHWDMLGLGILGSASTTFLSSSSTTGPGSDYWYTEPAYKVFFNHTPDYGGDITFNKHPSISWYTGTDGNPSSGEYDLLSVALHELGHHLGMADTYEIQNANTWGAQAAGEWRLGLWDSFLRDGEGDAPVAGGGDSFNETGNPVYFVGSNARSAYGNQDVPIYAPTSYAPGSSLSHLNEAQFSSYLMSYSMGTAEAIHSLSAVEWAMFQDLGWTMTPEPGTAIFALIAVGAAAWVRRRKKKDTIH